MIKKDIRYCKTSIKCRPQPDAESIENKIRRITSNNEPITDGAPLIYMERKDGINPDCDIRSDRFDYAIDAMTIASKNTVLKQMEVQVDNKPQEKADGGQETPPAA